MAKKKASKKAKAASKPAKATAIKKSVTAKSASKTKAVAKKKTTAKPAKKSTAKPAKKTAAKSPKKISAKGTKKVSKKSEKKTVVKSTKAVVKPAKVAVKPPVPKVKDEGWILAESVVNGILEKKGQNVKWLDLRSIENSVCDYFIICEGNSNTQVEAVAQSVEDVVKKETGQRPYRSEGWENALWILIDYVNVVVHVFEKETRYFYNLESLWADAEEIKVKQ